MKLYKLRALGNDQTFEWLEHTLRQGTFWCSRFWNMNDPMEGVYVFSSADDTGDVFTQKNKYVICSFSNETGFSNPAMWGYYANGFKGLAIQIEVPEDDVKKVNYETEVPSFSSGKSGIIKFLTTKLNSWRQEGEFRFLVESDTNAHKIGKITGVVFGRPYGNVENFADIEAGAKAEKSQDLKDYRRRAEKLFQIARELNIPCFEATVENCQVHSKEIARPRLWETP